MDSNALDSDKRKYQPRSLSMHHKSFVRNGVLFLASMAIFIMTSAFLADAHPALTLTKSASPIIYSGWKEITYTYTLTNSGDVPLKGPFTVQDDRISKVRCPDQAELPVGKSIQCRGSFLINAGQHWTITNTATGFGMYNDQPVASNKVTASVRYVRPAKTAIIIIPIPT
jgi:hypothetical protein